MRPVLLRMAGFGSYREPTTVDFRGTEYFALVGPTGSGKSTVIDAMTFALYGSVPRWDDRGTVSLALAPTAGRGTVSLVFDVGGARYVVARELRRASSGAVTVRSARLERLADPEGTGEPEDETEPLADGARQVSKQVEELLGLPFDDFCTCVVLPQGDFADFLHAAPNRRQEKLERILGFGVYDVIMRRANAEAATQQQRIDVLGVELGRYADATSEAEQESAARVGRMAALADRVDETLPCLAAARAELAGAEATAARIRSERALLAGLGRPAGVAALDHRHREAGRRLAQAGERAEAAERADTAARDRLRAAPARGPLEQARDRRTELAATEADLPRLRACHDRARAAYGTASDEAAGARAAVDDHRKAQDTAAEALVAATAVLRRLTEERDALTAAAMPDGVEELDRRMLAADAALREREHALTAAETAEASAREAAALAPDRGPLEQAGRHHRELAAARAEHRAAAEQRVQAERDVATADGRVSATRACLAEALSTAGNGPGAPTSSPCCDPRSR